MITRPTGAVTFLFTDIEGSTALWEHAPHAMPAAFARHEAILRAAIAAHDGWAYKQIGDAFQAAFQSAPAALAAAVDAQRALASEPWPGGKPLRVRMALHTGVTEERAEDYVGPLLNRLARLLAAGHGGQILLTVATYELVREYLPNGVELRDLGERRLKDLLRPLHVYQAAGPNLPSGFPPLKALDGAYDLPVQLTPLVGREREVRAVCATLDRPEVRLLTLTGPPGIGKTRLALQAGAELVSAFPDGVFFVPLAPIASPDLVLPAIAQTLQVRETPGRTQLESLQNHLTGKLTLLLLDNFEQVVTAAPELPRLLSASSGTKLLITSREVLHLYGERDYPVPALSVPQMADRQHPLPVEALTQYDAVILFLQRAAAEDPSFHLTEENAPVVAAICAQLEGLPLAIELAAARVRALTPQALLARLSERLRILVGGPADQPARQRTLRGAIEWSYDLLDETERTLFRRLSVFVGGCSIEAVEAVCNAPGGLGIDALEGATALIDKSLLKQQEGVGGEARYWMLETLREYAGEKLAESGEAEALRKQHALYFMAMGEGTELKMLAPQQLQQLARLSEEQGNMRAALQWAGERGRAGSREALIIGLRLAGDLATYWTLRGELEEARAQLDTLLSIPVAPAEEKGDAEWLTEYKAVRAKALGGRGVTADQLGEYAKGRVFFEESLQLLRQLGAEPGIVNVLAYYGTMSYYSGDLPKARALLEESASIAGRIGNQEALTLAVVVQLLVAHAQGDRKKAQILLAELHSLSREANSIYADASLRYYLGLEAFAAGDLGKALALIQESAKQFGDIGFLFLVAYVQLFGATSIAYAAGNYAAARLRAEEALAIYREIGHRWGVAASQNMLGFVAWKMGDYPLAETDFKAALQIDRKLPDIWGIARNLEGLGWVSLSRQDVARAVRLFAAGERLHAAIGAVQLPILAEDHWRNVALARAGLGEAASEKVWTEGYSMSLEQAIAFALDEPLLAAAYPDAPTTS